MSLKKCPDSYGLRASPPWLADGPSVLVPDNLPQLVEQTESATLSLTELACKLDGIPEVP